MDGQRQFQDTYPLLQGHKVLEDVTLHPFIRAYRNIGGTTAWKRENGQNDSFKLEVCNKSIWNIG